MLGMNKKLVLFHKKYISLYTFWKFFFFFGIYLKMAKWLVKLKIVISFLNMCIKTHHFVIKLYIYIWEKD